MSHLLEKAIEKKAAKWCEDNGIWAPKFSSPSNRAVPDRLLLLPNGVVVFCEFKRPGNTPTKLQASKLRDIRARRGNAFWTDDFETFKFIITTIFL